MTINKKSTLIYTCVITTFLFMGFAASQLISRANNNKLISENSTSFTLVPSSIDELTSNSSIILSGSFGEIVNKGEYTHYANGQVILATEKTPPELRISFIDYEVNVTEVISGNVTTDSKIIVRFPSEVDEKTIKKSEKLILFLVKNSDNMTYGPYYYQWGFIDVEKEEPTFVDQASSPIGFLDKNLKSKDLIDQVKQKVKK